ncbi:MAG: hypothetical protein JJE21_09285 [Spirochaetaceae bacterium]|nr:hypothetical protein [Spirochaetaceae bacterium]
MAFFDTQIISYVFKGKNDFNLNRGKVSSIVLNEFLELYFPCSSTTSKCYINPTFSLPINTGIKEISKSINGKPLAFCKRRADNISINLGNEFSSIVEFNGLGFHDALKNKDLLAFKVATYHYEKYEQKKLLQKVQFIFDNEITCYPLN